VSRELLNDGEPIVVTSARDRIGHGPWSRLFASAVVGDEGSAVAERGRALARAGAVHSVSVGPGELAACVVGSDGREHEVTLTAPVVPPRIWSAVGVTARHNAKLATAMAGREQSVHLEHLMRFDWTAPLIPNRTDLERRCTCAKAQACEHTASFAYVVADQIDSDPSMLLSWRGCGITCTEDVERESEQKPTPPSTGKNWRAGHLPPRRSLRPLPVGAVLMCLGPTDLRIAGGDFTDALRRAYASLAETQAG
jgi:uncharacterized Zn finger protein